MAQHQTATGVSPVEKSTKGGAGKSRGARPFSATAKAAATRLLNEHHDGGRKKVAAVEAALTVIEKLAADKNERVTEDLKVAVLANAEKTWAAAKK